MDKVFWGGTALVFLSLILLAHWPLAYVLCIIGIVIMAIGDIFS